MRSSVKFENRLIMLSQMENDSVFQVLEYEKLQGAMNSSVAKSVNSINKAGGRLKQVRIVIENSAIKIEPGVVSYIKGDVNKINSSNKALALGKKLISNRFSNELYEEKPIFGGRGEVFLEPSFQDYVLIELEDEEVIVDDGLFLACEESVEIKSIINGRKYETTLSGSGIVVLELPVPSHEVFKCKLYNDLLKVDGDFAILRGGNVKHYLEPCAAVSGNEMINVYSGIGDVWILPTKGIYSDIMNIEDIDNYLDEE